MSSLGALFLQAAASASFASASPTLFKSTFVEPRLPQPPGTGANVSGCRCTNDLCCLGVNNTAPRSLFDQRVARILLRTWKSDLSPLASLFFLPHRVPGDLFSKLVPLDLPPTPTSPGVDTRSLFVDPLTLTFSSVVRAGPLLPPTNPRAPILSCPHWLL